MDIKEGMECKQIDAPLELARKWKVPIHLEQRIEYEDGFFDASMASSAALQFFCRNKTYDHVMVCCGETNDEWHLYARTPRERCVATVKSDTPVSPNLMQYPLDFLHDHNQQLATRDNAALLRASAANQERMAAILRSRGLDPANVPFLALFSGAVSHAIRVQEANAWKLDLESASMHREASKWLMKQGYFVFKNAYDINAGCGVFLAVDDAQKLEWHADVVIAAASNRFPVAHFTYSEGTHTVRVFDPAQTKLVRRANTDLSVPLDFCAQNSIKPVIVLSGVDHARIKAQLTDFFAELRETEHLARAVQNCVQATCMVDDAGQKFVAAFYEPEQPIDEQVFAGEQVRCLPVKIIDCAPKTE